MNIFSRIQRTWIYFKEFKFQRPIEVVDFLRNIIFKDQSGRGFFLIIYFKDAKNLNFSMNIFSRTRIFFKDAKDFNILTNISSNNNIGVGCKGLEVFNKNFFKDQ